MLVEVPFIQVRSMRFLLDDEPDAKVDTFIDDIMLILVNNLYNFKNS